MWMTAGERRFAITLTDNPAAGAFAAQLPLASTIAFHLYPNVNLFFNTGIFTAVRNYPDATRVGQSMTRVTFFKPDHTLPEAIKSADMSQLSGENLYTPDVSKPMAFSLSAMMELFNSSVEREDYIAGAHIQVSANSAMLDKVMFGSNEPGLHHFHKNYRNALGLPPLEPHRAA